MRLRNLVTITLAVGMLLTWVPSARADRQQIAPGRSLSLSGASGGQVNSSDCGFIAQAPNHVIDVAEDLPYWQIIVTAAGSPTLLIDGPGGRYCVLPQASGLLQYSGYGTQGSYNIYIGDRASGQHPYRILISDQK